MTEEAIFDLLIPTYAYTPEPCSTVRKTDTLVDEYPQDPLAPPTTPPGPTPDPSLQREGRSKRRGFKIHSLRYLRRLTGVTESQPPRGCLVRLHAISR